MEKEIQPISVDDFREVIVELKDLQVKIQEATELYYQELNDLAIAHSTYDVQHAVNLLTIGESFPNLKVAEKEAMACKNTSTELFDMRTKQAIQKARKQQIDTYQSLLTAIQTRAGLLKAELSISSQYK